MPFVNIENKIKDKMRSTTRTLVLSKVGDVKSSIGVVDKRLFTGGNSLRAIQDKATCMWRLRYDFGILPEALKTNFTNFDLLVKTARQYFKPRNIDIKEVLD